MPHAASASPALTCPHLPSRARPGLSPKPLLGDLPSLIKPEAHIRTAKRFVRGRGGPPNFPQTQDQLRARRSGSEAGCGRSPRVVVVDLDRQPRSLRDRVHPWPDRSAIESTHGPTRSAGRGNLGRGGARVGRYRYGSRGKVERYAHKSTAKDLRLRCAASRGGSAARALSPSPADGGLASLRRANSGRLHRYGGGCRGRRGECFLPRCDLGRGHLGAVRGGDQVGRFAPRDEPDRDGLADGLGGRTSKRSRRPETSS